MRISPIGIAALQELKKHKGFEKAIIAGGFVRDAVLGAPFKDCDIFVPVQNFQNLKDIMQEITPKLEYIPGLISKFREVSISNFSDFEFTKNDIADVEQYAQVSAHYVGKCKCKYMETLDVEIMGYRVPEEDFGQNVVNEFHFWIDQIWYDDEIHETENFLKDKKNSTATLCKIRNIAELPYAVSKFFRHKEKYPDLRFNMTYELKEKDNNKENQYAKAKQKYVSWGEFAPGVAEAGPNVPIDGWAQWRERAAVGIEPRRDFERAVAAQARANLGVERFELIDEAAGLEPRGVWNPLL